MLKVLGIAAVLATALGGWIYETSLTDGCKARVAKLESAYQHEAGAFGPGEMMSGLKTARDYCEVGEADMAERALHDLAGRCRSVGGCI
jgi:hypothetical protein